MGSPKMSIRTQFSVNGRNIFSYAIEPVCAANAIFGNPFQIQKGESK